MLNFTIGPVMASEEVRSIGYEQIPYFRTPEFSNLMLENERIVKSFAKADDDSRVVFITGSGSAAMEAAVINVFTEKDKVLVIDGGSFGHRFVELLQIYGVPHERVIPDFARGVSEAQLSEYDDKGFTGFLVNLDETTTGVLYDINLISEFCKRNDIFLVVDSISFFLCDPFDMKSLDVQVMIAGSQKALACPHGISIIVLSQKAVDRVFQNNPRTLYFDFEGCSEERGKRANSIYPCRGDPSPNQQ